MVGLGKVFVDVRETTLADRFLPLVHFDVLFGYKYPHLSEGCQNKAAFRVIDLQCSFMPWRLHPRKAWCMQYATHKHTSCYGQLYRCPDHLFRTYMDSSHVPTWVMIKRGKTYYDDVPKWLKDFSSGMTMAIDIPTVSPGTSSGRKRRHSLTSANRSRMLLTPSRQTQRQEMEKHIGRG